MSRRIERLLLILILLVALGVRLYGLGFDLPYTTHPDEPNVVDRAVATLQTGDWNPHWFIYPSGYHYLQTVVLTAHTLWGIARGLYGSPADLPASSHVITTAPEAYLWARGTTVLFGLLTVALVYRVGRRLAPQGGWVGPAAGLSGALLLALSPLHTQHSHYVTTDVPTAALSLLALSLSLDLLEHGGGWRALLAGVVVGLSAGFKYNGALALLPLLLALMFRAIESSRRPAGDGAAGNRLPGLFRPLGRYLTPALGLALLGVVLGYTVACPFTFADLPVFLDDLGYETHIYRFGGEGGVIRTYEVGGRLLPPWQAYAHALFRENPLAALAYLGGSLLALTRRRKQDLLVLAHSWGYYLFLSSYASIFVRNVLPALPGLAALGGAFLAEGTAWLTTRPRWRRPVARCAPLLLALLVLAMLVQPARGILAADAHLATPTSQVQARRWLDQHVAPGERVAAELHPLLFARSAYQVTPVDYLSNYPLEALVNGGYRYVVVSSEQYGPEFAEADTLPDYYAVLLDQLELVADFAGHTGDLPGPRLTIYRVPGEGPRPQHALEVTTEAGLRLLGFDLGERRGEGELAYVADAEVFYPGETLGLTLYLQADQPQPVDLLLSLRLLDSAGRTVAWQEQPACGEECPPTGWPAGTTVAHAQDLSLSAMLAPGTYRLTVSVLDPQTGDPLPLSPPAGEGALLLAEVRVEEAAP